MKPLKLYYQGPGGFNELKFVSQFQNPVMRWPKDNVCGGQKDKSCLAYNVYTFPLQI